MQAQGDPILHSESLPEPQEQSHPTSSTLRSRVLLLKWSHGSLGDEQGVPEPHLLPSRTNKR